MMADCTLEAYQVKVKPLLSQHETSRMQAYYAAETLLLQAT